MGLGYLELDGDPQTQEQYQQFLEELQNIEKDIREVSHQLSSDISLSETSFLNAVNQLLKEKSKLGNFEFQLKMDDGFSWKDLDGILEMNLFRILQESLQNIIKHAKAKHVFVSFKVENQELYFSVKDDGVGFDTTQKAKGIGLKNIQSRAQNMKGAVAFNSNKQKGTKIEIRIPLLVE
jgi:signal transduction histidine kinase